MPCSSPPPLQASLGRLLDPGSAGAMCSLTRLTLGLASQEDLEDLPALPALRELLLTDQQPGSLPLRVSRKRPCLPRTEGGSEGGTPESLCCPGCSRF